MSLINEDLMGTKYLLELVEYTDPYCTWCWGLEPVLRKVEEVYGGQIKISFKMGGLVKDMTEFHDAANKIGGPNWFEQVAAHWLEASSKHGMPVDERIFFDIKDKPFSTHPANIAFKAAQFQDDSLAKHFLRRMREGVAVERQDISLLEVQAQLAEEVGLDRNRLIADIKSGRAREAFEEELKEGREQGVRGFPTFLLRSLSDEKEVLIRGFQQFEDFVEIFGEFAGDTLNPVYATANEDNVLAFLRKHKRVAPKEVAEVFDLSEEDVGKYLKSFVAQGLVKKERAGNGFFYTL